jgi:hypothetical protein
MKRISFYPQILLLLIFLNPRQIHTQTADLQCPGGIPTGLYYHNKTNLLYAGCWGGIWEYGFSSGSWREVDADPDSNILANAKIKSILIDSKDIFYACSDGNTPSYISYDMGIKWRPIESFLFTLQNVNCITEHPNGTVYFGTNSSILKTSDNGKTWEKVKNSPANVNSIVIKGNGCLLAGTAGGLYTCGQSDTIWNRLSTGGFTLPIQSIVRNSKGEIYAAASNDYYKSSDDGIHWGSLKKTADEWVNLIFLLISKDDKVVGIKGIQGFGGNLSYLHEQDTTWYPLPAIGLFSPLFTTAVFDSKNYVYSSSSRYGLFRIVYEELDVEESGNLPSDFNLYQNYPNPFNSETTIQYSVPAFGIVSLKLYDLLGNEVAILVNEYKPPGLYNSKCSIPNSRLPSGIYFYRLQTGGFSSTKKMILLK